MDWFLELIPNFFNWLDKHAQVIENTVGLITMWGILILLAIVAWRRVSNLSKPPQAKEDTEHKD